MADCPTCGQPIPPGIRIQVARLERGVSVVARRGSHSGWALRPTEDEATAMAIRRLEFAEKGFM